jgi:hypothetical protein
MNLFYWFYDYFFVNHTIDEQMEMHNADLILLQIFRQKLNEKIKRRSEINI